MARGNGKRINIALQGGGAHGAYAWGILDKLLEDGRLEIEAISASSSGAMTAAAFAHGAAQGDGPEGVRAALEAFWHKVSQAGGLYTLVRRMPWDYWLKGLTGPEDLSYSLMEMMTRLVSPYQFNPFNLNPLHKVVEEEIDFEAVRTGSPVKLFISAVNVRSGQLRVFTETELTSDMVMASACLPFLFHAVEIDGQPYWDGAYMANPALFPLVHDTESADIFLILLTHIARPTTPADPAQILSRINELGFNASLARELRGIRHVNTIIRKGWIARQHRSKLKKINIHAIDADEALADLTFSTKYDPSWSFIADLRDRGRAAAAAWLEAHFDDVGRRSTVDMHARFMHLDD